VFFGSMSKRTEGVRFQVSGVSSKKARAGLKPCMKLRQNGTVFLMIKLAASMAGLGLNSNRLNVEHRTSNIERPTSNVEY
jgi:hypothetical protein